MALVSLDGVAPSRIVVCLPMLIFFCTMKSRISLLALAHPGGPGKRAAKWSWLFFVKTAKQWDEENNYTDRIESWLIIVQRMNPTVNVISIFAVYERLASQSVQQNSTSMIMCTKCQMQ